MSRNNEQQILINKVAEHVSEKFDLNGDYRITNFKAKDTSITLDSVNYEVTIKCKGQASEKIHQEVYEEYKKLREEKEANEQFEE